MHKLVQEILRSMQPDIQGRQVEWRVHKLPATRGDAALLRQALYNLVDNALKYSRDRAPAVIEISGEQHASECVYTVKDNGVGFDMAYANKLFVPFQRLHPDAEFQGSGIGLVTSQRIIARHNGRIWADAQINEGATFYFTIGAPLASTAMP